MNTQTCARGGAEGSSGTRTVGGRAISGGDRNGEAVSSKHEKAQPEALGAHEQTAQSEAWLPVGQRGPGGVCELRRIVPVT